MSTTCWRSSMLSRGLGLLVLGFLFNSCASPGALQENPKKPKSEILSKTREVSLGASRRSLSDLQVKIRKFRRALARGKSLSEADWKLHDELLSEYIELKSYASKDHQIVIPARGYRYISSKAPYLEDLERSGRIPENPHGTYVSFSNYERQDLARQKLQLPNENDAVIRIEFDTKQLLTDVRIPRGRYGTADYLEPLTKDYPEFGVGRGTQAITNSGIQASRIVDLNSGKVLYEAK